MSELAPIPIPPKQRWREFRIRFLPALVFFATAGAVTILWRDFTPVPSLVGQVEPVTANIASPKSGVVANLHISRFQRVKAGDSVAEVVTTDPRILQSSLAVILAEIKLLQLNLQPVTDEQRYTLNYDRLRLDWMQQRVDLATARTRLQLAENDLRRASDLRRQGIVSEAVHDQARTDQERLKAEVEERSRLINEMQTNLDSLRLRQTGSAGTNVDSGRSLMEASIHVQEQKLKLTEAELSPITLRVPVDGVIGSILRRSGETVMAGDPIATITGASSDRILAYVREPQINLVKPGMSVEVRARSGDRASAEGKVIETSSHLEQIKEMFLPPAATHVPEMGRSILVSLPPSLKLLPGELVDLRLRPEQR